MSEEKPSYIDPFDQSESFELLVSNELLSIKQMLVTKNRKYGDSALKPKRIFSKANNIEQIKVRIDDKLSRLANQEPGDDEDAELDLLGYLILLRIAKTTNKTN